LQFANCKYQTANLRCCVAAALPFVLRFFPAFGAVSLGMPLTVQDERRLVAELFRLAAARDAAERQRQADFDERNRLAVAEFRDAQQGISKRYRIEKETAEREYSSLRNRAVSEADTQITEARAGLDNRQRRLSQEFNEREAAIKKEFEDATWEAGAIFESRQKGPKELVEQTDAQVAEYLQRMETSLNRLGITFAPAGSIVCSIFRRLSSRTFHPPIAPPNCKAPWNRRASAY
jgi:hypothetical protein